MEIKSPDAVRSSGDQILMVEAEATRLNVAPPERTSWNRSLSIRGRESIILVGGHELRTKHKQRGGRRKLKQLFPTATSSIQSLLPRELTVGEALELEANSAISKRSCAIHEVTWNHGIRKIARNLRALSFAFRPLWSVGDWFSSCSVVFLRFFQRLLAKTMSSRGSRREEKKVSEQLYDFTKEKAYFEEVDAFELLEEGPSPNKFSWEMGTDYNSIQHDLTAILGRWKRSKLFSGRGTSWPLSNIMETMPVSSGHTTSIGSFNHRVANSLSQIRENSVFGLSECKSYSATQKSTKEPHSEVASNFSVNPSSVTSRSVNKNLIEDLIADSVLSSLSALSIKQDASTSDKCEDSIAFSENKAFKVVEVDGMEILEDLPRESCDGESLIAFEQLLMVCKQSCPTNLSKIFLNYCGDSDAINIIKLGEGTYGEAFRAGETVCKIVPIDGDLVVNGEVQKKSEEVLEEVLLSLTLNSLKEQHAYGERINSCSNFIETKGFLVCQGLYDTHLIRAWEDWDAKNNSENDHPCAFPEDQRYIVFVLADGGKDLESFVLLNFNEARSLLVQVTAALAVAEVACEFEHRDLHWGNILLCRNGDTRVDFTLEGKKMIVNTFGLTVSIIDFTLSRINNGEAVLFLNLSEDPELFKGPKGNIQSETYRRMKEVTADCWEESFPKTNVLWLMYLVDILDKKKIYERTIKDERNLRSFKRRLSNYESAKDSLSDPFLSELIDY